MSDIRYKAQSILSRRDHSEAEMRRKLSQKGYDSKEVEDVIAWLYAKHFLDDARYADTYVETVIRIKHVGPRWVEAKLRQRGVDQEDVESALAHHMSKKVERNLAHEAAKKWKALHPQHAKDVIRLQRFLVSRGFSSDVITEL